MHGEDFPLALNVQYAGKGLWGMDYRIDRPTEFSYSILPHQGNWEQCRLWTRSEERNEPLIATLAGDISLTSASFLSVEMMPMNCHPCIMKERVCMSVCSIL